MLDLDNMTDLEMQSEDQEIGDFYVVSHEQCLMGGNANIIGVRCNNNFGVQLRSWRQGVKSLVIAWLNNGGKQLGGNGNGGVQ